MKIERLGSMPTRAAVAVLAAMFFFAASQQVSGQFVISFGGKKSTLAVALAGNVEKVVKQLKKDRRALRDVPGPDGKKAFPEEEVADVIARTENEVDQALVKAGGPDLDALRAWAAEEFRQIREDLAPSPDPALQAVARVASLGGFSLPKLASVGAVAPQQKLIPAETAQRLLDRAEEVVNRIFVLAKKDDLEVKLWFGSAPEQPATLSFWPQGKIKGAKAAPRILQSNEQRDGVLRGLYSYRAARGEGAVSELITYPTPAAAPDARASEALDLVNESSFFCCQFQDHYCRHVNSKKECRR